MKSDTERKKYYTEKLHLRKGRLHVHLSKDLRSKLRVKKRALLVRKGDTVRVMRGPGAGKEAKVSNVNTIRRKVFLEGVAAKTARGREVPVALEPSNLLLLSLEATKERKEIFSEEAFRKKEPPKKEAPKAEAKEEAHKEHEHGSAGEHGHEHAAHKPEHAAHEHKTEHKTEHAEHGTAPRPHEHAEHKAEHKEHGTGHGKPGASKPNTQR